MTEQHPFKWRHFEAEIILLCVLWYVRYALNYRDLEEMMAERRLSIPTLGMSHRILSYTVRSLHVGIYT